MSGANLRKGQSPFYGSDTIALVDLNYTLVENSQNGAHRKFIHSYDRSNRRHIASGLWIF